IVDLGEIREQRTEVRALDPLVEVDLRPGAGRVDAELAGIAPAVHSGGQGIELHPPVARPDIDVDVLHRNAGQDEFPDPGLSAHIELTERVDRELRPRGPSAPRYPVADGGPPQ